MRASICGPMDGTMDGASETAYCLACGGIVSEREMEVYLAFWVVRYSDGDESRRPERMSAHSASSSSVSDASSPP